MGGGSLAMRRSSSSRSPDAPRALAASPAAMGPCLRRRVRSAEQRLQPPPTRGFRRRRQRAELLDAIVVVVRHEDITAGIRCHASGCVELARAGALVAPFGDELARAREYKDPHSQPVRHIAFA